MKALFQAIRQGNEGQIHKLVADGANLNAFDPGTQKTPLIYAIASGNKVSVRLLLELGAHPNLVCQVDEEPRTPLSEACARGNEAIARLLVEHGADIHWQEGQHRRSMMHWAAQGGGVWIVERLLQEGITIDIQDAYGGTPLHEAVRNGHHELCQLLLARGAHINARLHSGPSAHMTPLSLALKMGFPKIVALLLQSGAQIDPAVFLSLLQLTERPKDLTEEQQKYIARLILAHGQQSDIAPAFTKKPYVVSVRTALEYCTEVHAEVRRAARMLLTDCALSDLEQALLAGERHKVEELLEQVVFQEIEANRKLLFDAITSGSPAIVQHFLARGMNANTADPETGETLLHRAVKLNQWEIVHLLLKAGANVNVSLNIRDRRGTPVSPPETPLAMALKYADERMLRLLLKAGAQVNPERRNDWVREYGAAVFPLHQTSNSQHIRLLLDVGANPNLALEYALEQRVAPRRYAQSRLEMAVEQDEIEVASILLEHRARFRSGSQGGSLLYHALKNRSLDMLDLLLAHHAQPIGSQDLPPNLPPHMLQRLTRAGIALPKRREYAKLDAANCTYAGNLQRTGEFQAQGLTNFHDIRWSFATAGHIYVPPLAGHDSI
ncbi:MAG: ankyrin repeat domain-containing protein, partial [Ktedonobacteraceae bacterium]|nr:ankyrin repeat domain-containing protein [Ktedonobacteraceae bacterium]